MMGQLAHPYPQDLRHNGTDQDKRMADIKRTRSARDDQVKNLHEKPFTVLSAMVIGYGTTNTAVGLIFDRRNYSPHGQLTLVLLGVSSHDRR